MKKSELLFGVARVVFDALAVAAALLLSYTLRRANIDLIPRVQLLEPVTTLPEPLEYVRTFVLPSVLVFLIFAAFLRLYVLRATHGAWAEVGRVCTASALWLVWVMGWYFLIRKQLFYSRFLLVHALLFEVVFVTGGRAALVLLQRSLLQRGIGRRLVVSVGMKPPAHPAREVLERDVRYQYLGHLQDFEQLKRLQEKRPIDLVLQTDPHPESDVTLALIDYCRSHHIGYGFLPPILADVPHQLRVERLGLVPLICFQPTPLDGWGRIAKRLFDLMGTAILLIVFAPLMLIAALSIFLETGWPILYISRRVGERGFQRIPILKFRTMMPGADRLKPTLEHLSHRRDGPLFKMRNDPRVTRVGRVLRRFSLDELPQLFNVFLGQLSLVGPRPHLPEEVARYSLRERRVFAVRPGVTGLAQVSGRSDVSFDDEVRLDLQYIEEWSLPFDLWILWRTIFTILSKRGAD
jgi:exopolysaccharide biosynthesis polyprenyl glycosylphosphotransferase